MLKCLALASLALAAIAPLAPAQKPADVLQRIEVPGEVVVAYRTALVPADVKGAIRQWSLDKVDASFAPSDSQMLARWQRPGNDFMTNIALLKFGKGANTAAIVAELSRRPDVEWAEPNMEIIGDPREAVPNDTQYASQYHHPLMQNNLAWDASSGFGSPSVIIAITDDGVRLAHEDLAPNIWINTDEIAGNGIDDDANGFIDDRNGWDFSANDAIANPEGSDTHGTHVAGIAAGRTNNALGVAGIAGGCTIMPVRFYGTGSWTATVIFNSFKYAVDNGAKIINTSYNIDGWVGNATVESAFNYVYDNGVLHMNSAGNNSELNPARQAFHQTMLVVSTTNTDARSSFSNYGTGCDISAPGSNILATLTNSAGATNLYGTQSGTSMATPAAAGAAALIWSKNPSWTRDQVGAQLYATANNINAQNPTEVGLLGGGRANTNLALNTATLPAPKVESTTGIPAQNGSTYLLGETAKIRFNQVMAPATVNAAGAIVMTYAGPDGGFGTPDDSVVPTSVSLYRAFSNEATLNVPSAGTLACGRYRIVASGSMKNPFNTNLDGDGNGSGGDNWSRVFMIEPCPGDTNCDTLVNVTDLLAVIAAWGNTPGGRADINGDFTVNVTDLLAVIAAWGGCPPPPPPPINNNACASPRAINAVGAYQFDTTAATPDGPAVTSCTNTTLDDVWVLFTPPSTGTATVNTCAAATFDTYLVAYSGSCGALTQITCNDDTTCGGSTLRSQITFPVTAGVARLIRLGGYNGSNGTGTLTISIAP